MSLWHESVGCTVFDVFVCSALWSAVLAVLCYINKTNLNLTLIKQIKYFIGLITSHNLWDL